MEGKTGIIMHPAHMYTSSTRTNETFPFAGEAGKQYTLSYMAKVTNYQGNQEAPAAVGGLEFYYSDGSVDAHANKLTTYVYAEDGWQYCAQTSAKGKTVVGIGVYYNYTAYTFYTDVNIGETITADTVVNTTSNVEIYARWATDDYTITYDLAGGTLGHKNFIRYNVNSTFTLNNPTKEGYTFAGWTGSNGTTPQTTVTIQAGTTGNKSYTANWSGNVVKVTLDKQGGTGGTDYVYFRVGNDFISLTDNGGDPLNKISCPTKTGYTFNGYYAQTGGGGNQYISATGSETSNYLWQDFKANVTIYAYWTANNYTVTFDTNGGSTLNVTSLSVTFGAAYNKMGRSQRIQLARDIHSRAGGRRERAARK